MAKVIVDKLRLVERGGMDMIVALDPSGHEVCVLLTTESRSDDRVFTRKAMEKTVEDWNRRAAPHEIELDEEGIDDTKVTA